MSEAPTINANASFNSESRMIRPSPTVESLLEIFAGDEHVYSSIIALELQGKHPEYGGGKWPNLSEKGTPNTRSMPEWLSAISDLFDGSAVEQLHGRLVLIGLALIDHDLAPFLAEEGFLNRIESEIKEPLERLLTPQAFNDWKQVISSTEPPSPDSTDNRPDNVPTLGDHPALEDELGRQAFARALARRIIRVRETEKWQSTKPSTYTTFTGFLKDKLFNTLRWPFSRASQSAIKHSHSHSGAFMLHIHGPWGSGKSTLMNFINTELKSQPGDDRWLSVYFNAWRYQRLGPPWWTLTNEVYRQTLKQLEDEKQASEIDQSRARNMRYNETWWRIFTGWGPYLVAGGLLLWLLGTTGASLDIISNLGQLVTLGGALLASGRFVMMGSARGANTMLEMSGDPMGPLVQHFQDIVNRTGHPIIIFIDDLDRCDGEYVIKLLHGIQTMFWNTEVAYVVAADRHWLRAAYENSYQSFSGYVGEPGRPLGYLFLEKLFQLSASVPKLDNEITESYWSRLIGIEKQSLYQHFEEARARAKTLVEEHKTEEAILSAKDAIENKEQDPLLKQAVREETVVRLASAEIESHTHHTLTPFAPLLEKNPRAMKRMVNAYGIRRAIDILSGGNTEREVLALWTIIELRWPLLAEHLSENPEHIEDIIHGRIPTDDKLDESLNALFISPAVKDVVMGNAKDINARLTQETIKICTGHSQKSAEALSGLMV